VGVQVEFAMSEFVPLNYLTLAEAVEAEGDFLSLRRKLYSAIAGEATSAILIKGGQVWELPPAIWGDDELAEGALKSGRIEYFPGQYGFNWSPTGGTLEGRVLVSEKLFAEQQPQTKPKKVKRGEDNLGAPSAKPRDWANKHKGKSHGPYADILSELIEAEIQARGADDFSKWFFDLRRSELDEFFRPKIRAKDRTVEIPSSTALEDAAKKIAKHELRLIN